MQKYKLIVISIILFLVTFNVNALTLSEFKDRKVCSNFEIAIAKDRKLTNLGCYNDYNSALADFNKSDNDRIVILERKNNETRVINAKNALVYLGVHSSDTNTNYYSDKNLTKYITYMNHHANYGATDGIFLDFNYSNHAIKLKTNGVTGWIGDGNYIIVPLGFTGNFSFYTVTSTELIHHYSGKIWEGYSQASRVIDKKPEMLEPGDYFSWDGIYFYKYFVDLLKDYKNYTFENSVNKNNPYYNYYMYLPHRAKSNYSSDDIDAYFKNTKGFVGTIYGKMYTKGYSNMFGTGI